MCYDIDKKYGVPVKEISCPGCGQKYGHHNTKVDVNTQECSSCAKEFHDKKTLNLISAKEFIENNLGIKSFYE